MTFDETAFAQPGGNSPAPVAYDPNEFWLRTLLRWYIGLVIRPSPTIREIVERRPLLAGLGTVVCVSMILEGLSEVLYSNRDFSNRDFSGYLETLAIIGIRTLVYFLLACLLAALFALIGHLISSVIGSSSSFTGSFSAVAMLNVLRFVWLIPIAAEQAGLGIQFDDPSLPLDPFPAWFAPWGINWLTLLPIVVWGIILAAIVFRENYALSNIQAFVSTFASLVAVVAIWVLLLFIVVILLFVPRF